MAVIDRMFIETLEAMLCARIARLEVQSSPIETAMLRGEIKMLRVVMQEMSDLEHKVREDG